MDLKTVTVARARRQLPLIALAAIVAFVLLGVWASTWAPAGWEPGLLNVLALGPDAWGDLVRVVNTLGGPLPWAVMVTAIATIMWRFRGRAAAILVELTIVSDAVAFVVKVVVGRDRPDTDAGVSAGGGPVSGNSGC